MGERVNLTSSMIFPKICFSERERWRERGRGRERQRETETETERGRGGAFFCGF